jgi:hypothetical protein
MALKPWHSKGQLAKGYSPKGQIALQALCCPKGQLAN